MTRFMALCQLPYGETEQKTHELHATYTPKLLVRLLQYTDCRQEMATEIGTGINHKQIVGRVCL